MFHLKVHREDAFGLLLGLSIVGLAVIVAELPHTYSASHVLKYPISYRRSNPNRR